MSTQHNRNKNTIKKTKLDKVDENLGSIAEYKRRAILKYCNDNGIKKSHLDELLISNNHHKLGMFHSFIGFLCR